jgi:hypothetical protein
MMALTETNHRAAASVPPAAEPPAGTGPASFGAAGPAGAEDRLVGLVAFALAAEKGEVAAPPTPEAVQSYRSQAAAALSDFSFRYLHNRVEEVRREAAAEATAGAPRPPGFLALVLANLLALAVAGAVAVWMAAHPGALSGLLGAIR